MTADKLADPVAPSCPHTILRKRGVGSDGGITIEAWDCPDCGVILLDRLAPAPQVEPLSEPASEPLRAALVDGMAYALARADLPSSTETSRDYAQRLAPLVAESGFIQASPPTAEPDPQAVVAPRTAAGREMVTVAAVGYYMDHWGVPTMKRAGILHDLHEEAKVEAEAAPSEPLRAALERLVALADPAAKSRYFAWAKELDSIVEQARAARQEQHDD